MRLSGLIVTIAVIATSWLLTHDVAAHDLQVDELRMWRTPAGAALHAEFTLDPELTRDIDVGLERSKHGPLVERFVRDEVELQVNDNRCQPTIKMRELYERGGAAPGDIVTLVCPTPDGVSSVKVSLGQTLPALLISAVGLQGPAGQAPVLLHAGESARFLALTQVPAPSEVSESASSNIRAASPTTFAIEFLRLGFRHVLPAGFDHLLFVLGMALVTFERWRRLALLVVVFTIAHTLSVGWVWFGGSLPQSTFIEPLITATIAAAGFGGFLRVRWERVVPVVGLFGIIHGLGFANSLAPKLADGSALFFALIGFNVGVEFAHFLVVFAVVGLLQVTSRRGPSAQCAVANAVRWGCLGIGVVGALWTLVRVLV